MPWAGQGYEAADPELLKGKADAGRVIVGVLPQNWICVDVFKRCEPVFSVGMSGPVWGGISSSEIRNAVSMMRVPRARWPYVLDGVRVMGEVAAEVRNKAAEAAATAAREEAKRGGKRGR